LIDGALVSFPRKQDKEERDEQESLLDLYLRAMESAGAAQAKTA